MGMNIYVQLPGCPNACAHCAHARQVHLGKFSAGWPFTFAAPLLEDGISYGRYDEWLKLAQSGPIMTEYGTSLDLDSLLLDIEKRHGTPIPSGSSDQYVSRDEEGRRWLAGEFS